MAWQSLDWVVWVRCLHQLPLQLGAGVLFGHDTKHRRRAFEKKLRITLVNGDGFGQN